jgi:hypothetical protein
MITANGHAHLGIELDRASNERASAAIVASQRP